MNRFPLGRCSVKIQSNQCHRWAKLVCSHCYQPICLEHRDVHRNENDHIIEIFIDQINHLKQKLYSFDQEKFIEILQNKLDQWKEKEKRRIEENSSRMNDELIERIKDIDLDKFRLNQLNRIDWIISQPLNELLQRSQSNISNETLNKFRDQFQMIEENFQEFSQSIDFSSNGFERKKSMIDLLHRMILLEMSLSIHRNNFVFFAKIHCSLSRSFIVQVQWQVHRRPIMSSSFNINRIILFFFSNRMNFFDEFR